MAWQRARRVFYLVCTLAALTFPSLAAASEYRGQVTLGGLPLPGATVTVTQGTKKFTAVSDQGGQSQERIARIMTERVALKLGFRRILSIIPGAVALAVPLAFGLVYATPNRGETQREDTAAKLPAYDVAAIKPDKSGMGPRILFSADRLTATRVTLKFLIKMAYGVEDDQILGASNWLNSETYDIEAKVDSSEVSEVSKLSDNQRMVMFQRLLADRFKLALHRETKELPVYALVIAKNGPKLQEAKPGDTYPNGIKGPDGKPAGHAGMMMWGRGRLTGQGIPIASLVPPLSQQLSRTVQDRTGLTGKYDIELHWTPDDAADPMTGPQGDRPTSENGNSAESPEPSFFTAIQEQLGLKLDSRKAPVEVLVIDHAEMPSAN